MLAQHRRQHAISCAASNPDYVGSIMAHDLKFGVVCGRFNDMVTERLLKGALEAFQRHGCNLDDVDVRGKLALGCLHH